MNLLTVFIYLYLLTFI